MILWFEALTFFSVLAAMLVSLVGLIVPGYPGLIIIWLAALAYGILSGFNTLGVILFIIITLMMVGGEIIDNVMMGVGARKTGVPWRTIVLAMLLGIFGSLFHPLLGIIAAPLTLYLLEWQRLKNPVQSFNSLKGLIAGWGLGLLARFGIGALMILAWLIWAWKG